MEVNQSSEVIISTDSGSFDEKTKKANKKNERQQWGNGLDFIFSAIGYAVGIGNVWRFPYLCYKNGGGAFLVPYFSFMLLLGIPMVYLEFLVGQFTSCGLLSAFKMTRITRGIGISMNIANAYMCIFYNMLIAYSLYFLFMSFSWELPWEKCNPLWSSPNCIDDFNSEKFTYNLCNNSDIYLKCDEMNSANFGKCFNMSETVGLLDVCNEKNETIISNIGYWKPSFPSDDYWKKVILQRSESIEVSGGFIWQLIVALVVSYIMTYLIIFNGIKFSGKFVWFLSTFPYVVLLVLGVRGWMLPGAGTGIKYYIIPKWSKLLDLNIWSEAASQIFFSLTISYGGMTTLSSYNNFNSNVMRDAIIVPFVNCLTSFFAGFVIFAYMGYLSFITGQEIDDIVQAGQGLAYVVYPFAVTLLPGAPIWAMMFFVMLILLGLDSSIANMQITLSSVTGLFPSIGDTGYKRKITLLIIVVIYFSIGLIFTLNSGTYWLEFFNTYAGSWGVLFIGAAECIGLSYLYGLNNFRNDVKAMLGKPFSDKYVFYIWGALWSVITPALLIFMGVLLFIQTETIKIGELVFPSWSLTAGKLLTFSVSFGIIGWFFYVIIDALLIHKRPILSVFKPDFESYMPVLEENKEIVRAVRGQVYETKKQDIFGYDNKSMIVL